MRPQLKDYARPAIENFIRQKVEESGGGGAVIGLSGGIDSATVSKLCADAIGPERVLNIFMPSASSSPEDRRDAEEFSKRFNIPFQVIEVSPAVEAFRTMLPSLDRRECAGNVAARCRMIVLFHHAWLMGRVVMGTSNKSELLTGYFTKFGDGGADFCPIGDLYKTEIRQLAREIGVTDAIIDKAPSAGLWEGQTDEGEMGITYEDLDQVLFGIERSLGDEAVAAETGLPLDKVRKVRNMHLRSVHKRKTPLIPKLGVRTLGIDWRE
ncbi:MAG: NAD+ synthase [Methanomassiliicoccus sp.]|nr:NAD+ synthase [Methanomassiliicoccus sp.]